MTRLRWVRAGTFQQGDRTMGLINEVLELIEHVIDQLTPAVPARKLSDLEVSNNES